MATQIQFRRGTTAEHNTFTGLVGEITVDTTKETVVVHDGSQVGGYPLLRQDGSNSALFNGSVSTPAIKFSASSTTGIYSPGTNQFGIATNGTARITIDASGNVVIANTLQIPLGSASAPSIFFAGDTTTGLYSPGANQVAISTNGTGRLFVDANGNIGFGTTPTHYAGYINIVHNGPSGGGATFEQRINGVLLSSLTTDTGNATLKTLTAIPLIFGTSNTERLRITSTGLVGIGNSAPSSALDVEGIVTAKSGTFDAGGFLNKYGGDANSRSWWIKSDTHSYGDFAIRQSTTQTGSSYDTKLLIDASGRVGIGTTSPNAPLEVVGSSDGDQLRINQGGQYYRIGREGAGGLLQFYGAQSGYNGYIFGGVNGERARIDSSGRLLVGTSTSPSAGGQAQYAKFVVAGNTSSTTTQGILNITRGQAASSTIGADTEVGHINFTDSVGNEFARITCATDAAVSSASDLPGRLVFSTTADGASSPTERMRINNSGKILVGKTTHNSIATAGIELNIQSNGQIYSTVNADDIILVNRLSNDGNLIRFFQDGTEEGNISVSGTTVSYNGAHLSRWSQLPSNVERTEILRGSVLSNIDEMCEWGEEDNEQLNRMKVSDVEGDPNVAGVFQAWDDDDDTYTNDFYCAMTGDFIIRIAAGVTVERGDLLMSAGDGTAKPQGDDIVRSKTVAKVTSTNVSCTYDDGSYCVPCVLMAC